MLSRIFWIGVAGIALIAGMALQDGDHLFSWGDHKGISVQTDRSIDQRVERAIESSFDKMSVVSVDGREVDVPAKTKRAIADAVGRLVKAETDMALARVGDDDEKELQAATVRRDQARAEIDRLKAEIKSYERSATSQNDAVREQIRQEIREDVRDTVRDAVGS